MSSPKPSKQSPREILEAIPLSRKRVLRGARACNLCGLPSQELRLMQECDEYDRPIVELKGRVHSPEYLRTLLFVGSDHPDCVRRVEEHPRLYVERTGEPGMFPKLCGSCIHREGFACRHPKAKVNRGEGLKVALSAGGIVCRGQGRGGCVPLLRHALDCEGQELQGENEVHCAG